MGSLVEEGGSGMMAETDVEGIAALCQMMYCLDFNGQWSQTLKVDA